MNNPNGVPLTWESVDAILAELRTTAAEHDRIAADRDAEVAAVTVRYADRLQELEARMTTLRRHVEDFLRAHHDEFGEPGARGRFRDLQHGRVGFRLIAPWVGFLRDLTPKQVIDYMAAQEARFDVYLRRTLELNRKAILEMPAEMQEEVGVTVIRDDDRPFIDLKTG